MVFLDHLERLYLGGFVILQAFVMIFPLIANRSANNGAGMEGVVDDYASDTTGTGPNSASSGTMEFLPLMITSVYCAIGLTWAFLRLSFIYLRYYTKN